MALINMIVSVCPAHGVYLAHWKQSYLEGFEKLILISILYLIQFLIQKGLWK